MNRPPRRTNLRFFGSRQIFLAMLNGCLLLAVALLCYILPLQSGYTTEESRTIGFAALMLGNIFLIVSQLSTSRPFYKAFVRSNSQTAFVIFAAVTILLVIYLVPAIRLTFGFSEIDLADLRIPAASAVMMLLLLEGFKYLRWRKKQAIVV